MLPRWCHSAVVFLPLARRDTGKFLCSAESSPQDFSKRFVSWFMTDLSNWARDPVDTDDSITWRPCRDRLSATTCVYVPTVRASPAAQIKFYTDLGSFYRNVPANDSIIILDDLSVRVGQRLLERKVPQFLTPSFCGAWAQRGLTGTFSSLS